MRWNSNKDDDTITRGQLRKALTTWRMTGEKPVTFGAYHSLPNLVDEVFHEVQGHCSADHLDPPFARGRDEDNCGEMTITHSELEASLNRLNYGMPNSLALGIFSDVKAHRDPQWKPYDVAIDANRVVWQRTLNGQWLRFGDTGVHGDSTPFRPLKRMTEES
jgi:hypothetical protein